jgi:hypothetical protein
MGEMRNVNLGEIIGNFPIVIEKYLLITSKAQYGLSGATKAEFYDEGTQYTYLKFTGPEAPLAQLGLRGDIFVQENHGEKKCWLKQADYWTTAVQKQKHPVIGHKRQFDHITESWVASSTLRTRVYRNNKRKEKTPPPQISGKYLILFEFMKIH